MQLIWKSAAPWPSLRGALYDNYLATAGGYFGVRAATGGREAPLPLHVQLNRDWRRATAAVSIVNRGLADATGGPFVATLRAYDLLTGSELPLPQPFSESLAVIPGSAVTTLQTIPGWPLQAAQGATLLWRLELAGPGTPAPVLSRNEYWLSNLTTDQAVPLTR